MRIEAIAFTERGGQLACQLQHALRAAGHEVCLAAPARYAQAWEARPYQSLDAWTRDAFAHTDALLFVSAAGIAVRAIAPYVHDKFEDPAVVSIDEAATFVVPLLSGHVGGANELARAIASASGAQAVISTATDVNGLFAVDEWARQQGLAIVEREMAKRVASELLAGNRVGFASDFPVKGAPPQGVLAGNEGARAEVGIVISLDAHAQPFAHTLHLVPRIVAIGVGCKRDTDAGRIQALIDACLQEAHIAPEAVDTLASIDVKADEPGLREVAERHGWKTAFYSAAELDAVPGEFASSAFVEKTVGVANVCERAACAAGARLVQGRRSETGVTVALAAKEPQLEFPGRKGGSS